MDCTAGWCWDRFKKCSYGGGGSGTTHGNKEREELERKKEGRERRREGVSGKGALLRVSSE